MSKVSISFTTFPSVDAAHRTAQRLVESGAAACVQILPPMTSIYRWRDAVEESTEVLMLVKSTVDRRTDIERIVQHDHSYECPEILHCDADGGSASYLAWVAESTRSK